PSPYLNGCLVALAVVWLWNVNAVLPEGQRAAEAVGYDLVSLGLPISLLWVSGARLKAGLMLRGIVAPFKWIVAGICTIWGTLGLTDFVQPTAAHRLGGFL